MVTENPTIGLAPNGSFMKIAEVKNFGLRDRVRMTGSTSLYYSIVFTIIVLSNLLSATISSAIDDHITQTPTKYLITLTFLQTLNYINNATLHRIP